MRGTANASGIAAGARLEPLFTLTCIGRYHARGRGRRRMGGERSRAQVRNPVLADLLAQVEALRQDARELTQGLSPAQLIWKPEPSRWSILQCLEHLTRTVHLYPERVQAMLAEAQQRAARREKPYRESRLMNLFVRGMEPPPKMRVRTMRSVNPPPDLDATRVLRDFDDAHALLASWIAAADGRSLVHARTT